MRFIGGVCGYARRNPVRRTLEYKNCILETTRQNNRCCIIASVGLY